MFRCAISTFSASSIDAQIAGESATVIRPATTGRDARNVGSPAWRMRSHAAGLGANHCSYGLARIMGLGTGDVRFLSSQQVYQE